MAPPTKPGFVANTNSAMQMKVELQDRTTTCVSVEAAFKAPHNLVFEMLSNPANHTRIFSSIKEAKHQLVEEKGSSKTWSLDYKTAWKFWKVGGVCDTRCMMWTDSDKGTVTFRLREPGFLKVYEGTWTIRPAVGLMDSHPLEDLQITVPNVIEGGKNQPAHHSAGPRGLDERTHELGRERGSHKLMVASLSMQADPLPSHSLSDSLKCWLGDYVGAAATVSSIPTSLTKNQASQLKADEPAEQVPPYTIVTVEKKMAPKMQPPYPLNLALKGNAAGQIQEMVESLITASQEMAAADNAGRK